MCVKRVFRQSGSTNEHTHFLSDLFALVLSVSRQSWTFKIEGFLADTTNLQFCLERPLSSAMRLYRRLCHKRSQIGIHANTDHCSFYSMCSSICQDSQRCSAHCRERIDQEALAVR